MLPKVTPKDAGGLYLIRFSDTHYYGGRAVNFRARWRRHLNSLEAGTHHPYIQNVWNKYGRFEPEVLEVIPDIEDMKKAEQVWLDENYGEPGCLNSNPFCHGGNGPHSESTRENMRGRKLSKEHRAACSLGQRRRFDRDGGLSEETRRKMSESRTGKPMPPGFGAKMSVIQKGRVFSEAHKEKLRKAWERRKSSGLETRCGPRKAPPPELLSEVVDWFSSGGSMRGANKRFFSDGKDHRDLIRSWLTYAGVTHHSRS